MQEIWKQLGSPRHLVVFEAAARLQSFTHAAQELNVQQPAVSVAIRHLEEGLGTALFIRQHRKVILTTAGERLMADVTRAFSQLAHSVASIQQLKQAKYVTLSASTAFNNYWIMPRLAEFQAQHPEIDLRLQSSDREPDIDAENISLAVRLGGGNWPEYERELIADEVIYPVAAPRIMEAAGQFEDIFDLLNQRLIHLEEPIRQRPSWGDWFKNFSVKSGVPNTGLRLNDYALVLQAAIAGEGFAFGWKHLTDRLVAQGVLAARFEWQWKTGNGFYLVWSKKTPLTEDAKKVRDWVLDNTTNTP
ncbi:LysR substrate-binding domain-containing protein [Shimia sp. MMG029]|uniref:LysR substrate-binding domain-containing protein n=1 Tax=Shimia sp. MMG029 TaxID=3021978 RepID=UPI0022FF138B|nr:LysR substrate-binding domain-containing protein [Shimia sp. MMG029]MDA5557759.1 LysR substrate-binding domain-containing protein [Shimia sp. MMG029]